MINFVTGNLRPIKSETDTELSSWYKQNSLVYVTKDHACWSDADLSKKILKKRFGAVRKSPAGGLNQMMEAHAEDVFQFINERLSTGRSGNTTQDEM